jgi:hypothetical protein
MPTPNEVISAAESLLGLGEVPAGSNHNLVTSWYGFDGAWCVMFDSYVLAHAGFSSDGGNTLDSGLHQTTAKGWAHCTFMRSAFAAEGRFSPTPAPGSFFILPGDVHTGLVVGLPGPDLIDTIEGNYGDHCTRVRRRASSVAGFCSPNYGTPSNVAPPPPVLTSQPAPFPGLLRQGSTGPGVTTMQQRLQDRGWRGSKRISIDGAFGPETAGIVHDFQQEKGLVVDEQVGPITWIHLWMK